MKYMIVLLILFPGVASADELIPYAEERGSVTCAFLSSGRYYVKGKRRRNRLKFSNGTIRHSCKFPRRYLNGYFQMPEQALCVGERFRLRIFETGTIRSCRVRRIRIR